MLIVEPTQWSGTRAELEAALAAHAAALAAHASAQNQPMPSADPLVERLYREGGTFQLRAEYEAANPPPPETLAAAKNRRRGELHTLLVTKLLTSADTAANVIAAGRTKLAAINSAATVGDVNALDLNAGW